MIKAIIYLCMTTGLLGSVGLVLLQTLPDVPDKVWEVHPGSTAAYAALVLVLGTIAYIRDRDARKLTKELLELAVNNTKIHERLESHLGDDQTHRTRLTAVHQEVVEREAGKKIVEIHDTVVQKR
jgi:hypothetical protein